MEMHQNLVKLCHNGSLFQVLEHTITSCGSICLANQMQEYKKRRKAVRWLNGSAGTIFKFQELLEEQRTPPLFSTSIRAGNRFSNYNAPYRFLLQHSGSTTGTL